MLNRHAIGWTVLISSLVGTSQGSTPPSEFLTPDGPIIDSKDYVMPVNATYNYADALHKTYLFYWAQKSGKNEYDRLAWRTDTCEYCKGTYGEDLSGGWYEAANTMKWGGPFGATAMQLNWNIYEYSDALKAMNEYEEAIMWTRQGADYLLNVFTKSASGEPRLMAMYGDSHVMVDQPTGPAEEFGADFGYGGPPEEYKGWVPWGPTAYYCTRTTPCSEIAGDYAAALASAAVVMRDVDPAYATRCINMAIEIYKFATEYEGTFMKAENFPEYQWAEYRLWYPSISYKDELAMSSAWIHIYTGEDKYLEKATTYLSQFFVGAEYSWANKDMGVKVLIHSLTKDGIMAKQIQVSMETYLPGGEVKRTPRGLAYKYPWGSLRYAANAAFLAAVHARYISTSWDKAYVLALKTFAVQQINYILGDCGRSWVVGFGKKSPISAYHKSSYNSYIDFPKRGASLDDVLYEFTDSATPNRHVLYGALVGGPKDDDTYVDNRQDYEWTEVTQDYNSGLVGALAAMIDIYTPAKFTPATDCGLDLGWSHPNASIATVYPTTDCYHTCNECTARPSKVPTRSPIVTNFPSMAPTVEPPPPPNVVLIVLGSLTAFAFVALALPWFMNNRKPPPSHTFLSTTIHKRDSGHISGVF